MILIRIPTTTVLFIVRPNSNNHNQQLVTIMIRMITYNKRIQIVIICVEICRNDNSNTGNHNNSNNNNSSYKDYVSDHSPHKHRDKYRPVMAVLPGIFFLQECTTIWVR